MPNRRHTVILLRGEGRELGRWEVTGRRVAAALGGTVALAGLAGLAGWLWYAARTDRLEVAKLRQENQTLRAATESFEGRVGKLQERVADTEDRTRKLAIVAGIENLGGGAGPGLGGDLNSAAGLDAAFDVLETRTSGLSSSLDRVASRVSENLELLSSTPSLWPVGGMLSSSYGWRRDPITGQRAFHDGVDISSSPGRPVQAAAAGVVAKILQYGGLGRAVYISHGFGVTTVYGHMSRILVRPGQKLERGDTLGLVGNTGRATGYHLHYEVQVNGRARNPLPYLLGNRRTRG